MKKLLIFFLVLLISANCYSWRVPNRIRKHFTNCYNGRKTDIESKLDIDGFYPITNIIKRPTGYYPEHYDTLIDNVMFYEDGTFVCNFFNAGIPTDSIIASLKRATFSNDSALFDQWHLWGIYRIENDTIIAQYLEKKIAALAPWVAIEKRYKIVDRQTIQYIASGIRDLEARSKQQQMAFAKETDEEWYLPGKFIASPYIPKPNSWLKRESWTHCENIKTKK